ncbi:MAG: hypothetical protein BMS9Abin36_0598 [Gammaproteobacteria bacterium]|nr:MAG: hypothetical protein BMS9Abin36_0598 [Gammaproteobacteria bacterium]
MSDKEKLSILMDDETNAAERERIIDAISRDQALREIWSRYHLIGTVIRQESAAHGAEVLPRRIAAGIEVETSSTSTVVSMPIRQRPMAKMVGSLAIAASVAVVALIGVQFRAPDSKQSAAQMVATTVPVATKDYIRAAGETRWKQRQPGTEHKLNMYLVEHNEFSPTTSIKGMMNYGLIAGYDNRK